MKSNGVEEFNASQPLLSDVCIPAGLTEEQRAQWLADFRALVAEEEAGILKKIEKENDPTLAIEAALRRKNKVLYELNKTLKSENDALESKLKISGSAMNALARKIGAIVATDIAGNIDPVQRLIGVVDALLQLPSSSTGKSRQQCKGKAISADHA